MTPTSIGQMVRWARKRAGMTQQDLATAVEMPQSTIARIEAGTVTPMAATLMALLKATGHQLGVEAIDRAVDPEDIRPQLITPVATRARRALGRRGRDAATSPLRILPRMAWFGVPFVLIGDLAEVVHGRSGVAGRSVDVCTAPTEVARERLARALADLGDRAARGRLRVLPATDAGDDYTALAANARRMQVDAGITARVASIPDLIRARRARGTVADLEVASELAAIMDAIGREPLL